MQLQQERGRDAIPPGWICQAFEKVADCVSDIEPFSTETDAVLAVAPIAELIALLQQIRPVGVKDRQTGKISVKCIG